MGPPRLALALAQELALQLDLHLAFDAELVGPMDLCQEYFRVEKLQLVFAVAVAAVASVVV